MAKETITEVDKTRVINAIRTAPSAEEGLWAVSVGWRCNRSSKIWAETVLEQLLLERRVVKIELEGPTSNRPALWRLK